MRLVVILEALAIVAAGAGRYLGRRRAARTAQLPQLPGSPRTLGRPDADYDLPTSILPTEPNLPAIRYMPREFFSPETRFGGWDPSDHFLSFPTLTIEARTLGQIVRGEASNLRDMERGLTADHARAFRALRKNLLQHGYVADQDGPETKLRIEYTVSVRVKAWPAVPGVTTPAEEPDPYR